ncbi:MAG TPA: glycosyltransferase family 2 protein [Longimicrobiales bacterium]|nr:glycosyltransferase family 2 protein [Longimicrobiales bacterium]
MSIYILIPAYNESERVRPVIDACRGHLPTVLIDDGSSDDTARIGEQAGAIVVRQAPNQGKGNALKEGFRWALKQPDCEAVITVDADGQHDPAELPKFLNARATIQSDLIIGFRDFSKMPFTRRLANTVGTYSISWAMGQKILDNQSGYRLISRRLMQATLESDEAGFEFEVDMVVLCIRRGMRLDWVPIRTIYAGEGSHIKPVQHIKNFFRVVRKTRRLMKQ